MRSRFVRSVTRCRRRFSFVLAVVIVGCLLTPALAVAATPDPVGTLPVADRPEAVPGDLLVWTSYGGAVAKLDLFNHAAVAPDGSLYAVGDSDSDYPNGGYMTVAKYPVAGGDATWRKDYRPAGALLCMTSAVAADNASGVVVTGTCLDAAGFGMATVHYDKDGTLLWAAVDRGMGKDVVCDAEGNAIVCGTVGSVGWARVVSYDYAADPEHPLVGHERWNHYLTGTAADQGAWATSLLMGSSGQLYVVGEREMRSTMANIFALKLRAADGHRYWLRGWSSAGARNDQPGPIACGRGGLAITATIPTSTQGTDIVLLRYSTLGRRTLVRHWNDADDADDMPSGVGIDGSGAAYVSGQYLPDIDPTRGVLVKWDRFGHRCWVRVYGTENLGGAGFNDLVVDGAGSAWVVGFKGGSIMELLLAKYTAAGSLVYANGWAGPPADARGGRWYGCLLCGTDSLFAVGEIRVTGGLPDAAAAWYRR